MIINLELAQDAAHKLYLKMHDPSGQFQYRQVCRIREATKILSRSRRQIYRLVQGGALKACGKILGEWLLDFQEVQQFALFPLALKRLPRSFKILFPEYSLSEINPYRDWQIVLSRILDKGGRKELAWAFARYPAMAIRQFLEKDGWRNLSPKSLHFWCLYFKTKPSCVPAWRASGRQWGGA